jgi:MraZ protein
LFAGKYIVSLSPKGRMFIPATFRRCLPENDRDILFVTRGFKRCIAVFDLETWAMFSERTENLRVNSLLKEKSIRELISRSVQIDIDVKGRIRIPSHLMIWARLTGENEATVVGWGDYFEIWNVMEFNREIDGNRIHSGDDSYFQIC